ARQLAATEGREMRRALLAVDRLDALLPAEGDERGQCDLRRVGAVREHRFAEEHAAERDTVEAAGEFAVDPGLEAVRAAFVVPGAIRLDHLGDDPGAGLAFARHRRAGGDDAAKSAVDAQLAAAGGREAAQRLLQR